jgi:PAS domain S-box-containing protein
LNKNIGFALEMGDRIQPTDGTTQSQSQSLTRNISQAARELPRMQRLYSPRRMLAITVGGIALAEVIAMIFIYNLGDAPYALQVLIDVTLMTVIIFPLLYYSLFNPLVLHIRKRNQDESILQTRLRLMQFSNAHTLDELLQFTLDEMEPLSGSTISFFHFLDADQKTLWLQAWSTNTQQNMCQAEGKDSHYDVDLAGVWADAVRQSQAIIHNDYAALPQRKGMPDGHAPVVREMVVPIIREHTVVAIIGVGNKPQDYTANDVEVVSTLADFAWDIIEHKRAEDALRKSEEKFRTLADWTYDWEKWMDPHGNIVYMSPSCQRITGYRPEEFIADPDLLVRIVHPDDRRSYEEHNQVIHDQAVGPISLEYRILSRDGSEHWIEHICRPLFGPAQHFLGRRVTNRDVTERKLAEKKISEQNRTEKILNQRIQALQTDIARDLHDTLGQNISFLRMNLDHLSETQWSDLASVRTQIQNMTTAANESYSLVRAFLSLLQVGDSMESLILFTRYAEQVAERSAFQVDISSQGNPKRLSSHQTRQLFFVFREALNNIEKYSHASQISCEFIWNDLAVTFVISDNGRGFDRDAVQTDGHYGLKFMRERIELLHGSFSVQSAPGTGTQITVVVPYEFDSSARLN